MPARVTRRVLFGEAISPDVIGALDVLASYSDALGWIVIGAFLLGTLAEALDYREPARYVSSAAWGLFGVFWLAVFPHFMFDVKSAVEGLGSLVLVPVCLYTGYLLFDGRDSLMQLTRAMAFVGLLYYPTQAIPVIRRTLIQVVTHQSLFAIQVLGYDPAFVEGPGFSYRNMFVFGSFSTYVTYACTGMGSISVFGGLTAATNAPIRRKVQAFGVAAGIIWLLNILRNSVVSIAAGENWFDHQAIVWLGSNVAGVPAERVSFWFSHSVLAQILAILAMVGIVWIVVRGLPELLGILREVLFVVTGNEYDLEEAFGVQSTRADGDNER
jgi:archaeosortase A (PGF-CTERM-specific)